MEPAPGFYVLTTGRRMSAEDAARLAFPEGVTWTLVETECWGRTISYTFLIGRSSDECR